MKDYTRRLANLQSRRTDIDRQKTNLSESFSQRDYGATTKWVFESMLPVDPEYNNKTFEAANSVKNHLTPDLDPNSSKLEFHYQGSVTTNTNIRVYSDIDLISVTSSIETKAAPYQIAYPITEDEARRRMRLFRTNTQAKLQRQYTYITAKAKAITLKLTGYRRNVDVVLANYYYTNEHYYSRQQEDMGLYLYNKDTDQREADYVFKQIAEVNKKGMRTIDGSKRLIRLAKNIKEDADKTIDLSSFELTSIVHGIDDARLSVPLSQQHQLLDALYEQLYKLILNDSYRDGLKSPNEKEYVFQGKTGRVSALHDLFQEVNEIRTDLYAELRYAPRFLSEGIPYIKKY